MTMRDALGRVAPRRPAARPVLGPALLLAALIIGLLALTLPEVGGLIAPIRAAQQALHGELAQAVQAVSGDPAAGLWLIGVGFVYGVLHAAGPGHGKVVIATYLGTQESGGGAALLRRGITLSCLSALVQGLTAIAIVVAATSVLELGLRAAQGAGRDFETLSYGLVAALGMWLVFRSGRRFLRSFPAPVRSGAGSEHHHDHHHWHDDQGCAACGHAHAPGPAELERGGGWTGMAGVVLSVGLRPCTGALLVLLIAEALDLRWAGIAAALAMAAGTALTVSTLAALTVHARGLALRLAGGLSGVADPRLTRAMALIGVAGGVVVSTLGGGLLWSALSTPSHPLLG